MVGADSCRIPRVPQYSGGYPMKTMSFRLRACHPLRMYVPVLSTITWFGNSTAELQSRPDNSRYPRCTTLAGLYMQPGLDSSRFARRYWGNLFDFFSWRYLDVSLPSVCLPHLFLYIVFAYQCSIIYRNRCGMTPHYQSRVAPFGYPRFYGYLHLPVAFRSLSRPSSPLCTEASTICP